MEDELARLRSILAEIADLRGAEAILGWDQQTYMPAGGAEARSHQSAALARLAHERATSAELGRLLESLERSASARDPDGDEARLVQVASRDYRKAVRVPSSWVAESTRATTIAEKVWEEARSRSDFSLFRPHLDRILDLCRRYVSFFPPADHPYDVLLDNYEPGMKTAEVRAIFDALKPRQVGLIKALARRPQADDSFLHADYDGKTQWDFGVEVITRIGFDWERGRQDRSVHPFTGGPGRGDVRITTRVDPRFLNPALFGTIHEMGHALYSQGAAPSLTRTPLDDGASMAVHESQSRMWENFVGRSLPFWECFYPRLQELFPAALGKVSLEAFYGGINRVQPSLIRVEADEATYNLHIMLRMDLEIAMLEGRLSAADLPAAWNAKMEEYLGLVPPDDAQGVLQDVHWSGGMMGYFPTYALGNLMAAQLWERIGRDIPGLSDGIRRGDFSALLGWLRENIHRHGRKFMPQELMRRTTGSDLDAAPYVRYLEGKFGPVSR